ncbi:MAG: IS66 family transposase, partial [Acetobacteraceae bacterium]|nr:IS66 family transposase [Acetobacteraceae bacterium]
MPVLSGDPYDLAQGGAAPIATEALRRIAALYRIEAGIRGRSAEERRGARQARSRPLLDELRAWFEAQSAKLPGSAPTTKAIGYALNHWEGLAQFLDDGRIEIDSNSVERSMRPVVLSRKNSLFAGSDVGASYCPSDDVPIKPMNFAEGRETPGGALTASPRHHGARRPAAGRRAGLSRA